MNKIYVQKDIIDNDIVEISKIYTDDEHKLEDSVISLNFKDKKRIMFAGSFIIFTECTFIDILYIKYKYDNDKDNDQFMIMGRNLKSEIIQSISTIGRDIYIYIDKGDIIFSTKKINNIECVCIFDEYDFPCKKEE